MADKRQIKPNETVQVNATDIEWIKSTLSSIGLKLNELDINFSKLNLKNKFLTHNKNKAFNLYIMLLKSLPHLITADSISCQVG